MCIFCFLLCFFVLFSFVDSPSVLWYCWLGLLTCKNRLPYNLYCVGGDVKHCSLTPFHSRDNNMACCLQNKMVHMLYPKQQKLWRREQKWSILYIFVNKSSVIINTRIWMEAFVVYFENFICKGMHKMTIIHGNTKLHLQRHVGCVHKLNPDNRNGLNWLPVLGYWPGLWTTGYFCNFQPADWLHSLALNI